MIGGIIEQLGKAGIVVALFSGTFGIFEFLDRISSKAARDDLAKYLLAIDARLASASLYEGTRSLFERIFGPKHFSLLCVRRSVAASFFAIGGLFALRVLHDPPGVFEFMISHVQGFPVSLGVLLGSYALWSLVPDYFNLLKTRTVLNVLAVRRTVSLPTLLIVLCLDFAVGFAVFAVCLNIMTIGFFIVDKWRTITRIPLPLLAEVPFAQVPLLARVVWKGETIASLFWAGMIPSIWLWLYTAAAVITRVAVRSAPVFRFLVYALDIKEHPLRSVGAVAGVLVSGGYIIYFLAVALIA